MAWIGSSERKPGEVVNGLSVKRARCKMECFFVEYAVDIGSEGSTSFTAMSAVDRVASSLASRSTDMGENTRGRVGNGGAVGRGRFYVTQSHSVSHRIKINGIKVSIAI